MWSPWGVISADGWVAIASMITAVVLSASAVSAAYTFRLSRKTDDARWIQDVFREFYLTDRFETERYLLEAGYRDDLEPLLDRTYPDRFGVFSREEASVLAGLDTFLNFLEWVLYLESKGQVRRAEREHVLKWWFDLIRQPERGSLRYFLKLFGFELLASEVCDDDKFYVVFYGTLLSGDDRYYEGKPDLNGLIGEPTPVELSGELWDLGSYPGLVPGQGKVRGELVEILDETRGGNLEKALSMMDVWEHLDNSKPVDREYVRKVIQVDCPSRGRVDAWIYYFNRSTDGFTPIESGDWLEHIS